MIMRFRGLPGGGGCTVSRRFSWISPRAPECVSYLCLVIYCGLSGAGVSSSRSQDDCLPAESPNHSGRRPFLSFHGFTFLFGGGESLSDLLQKH